MTVAVSNTEANSTTTVSQFRARVNQLAHTASNYAVTTDSNTATGNAAVTGSLQSNALFTSFISGGIVGVPANLNFTSNVTFQSRVNLGGGANVYVTTGNATHRVLTVNSAGAISAVKLTLSGDVQDSNITSAANGDVLVYSNAETAWKNSPQSSLLSGNTLALNGNPSTYYTNSTNQGSGTLPSGRLTGSYSGITAVGTLGSLTVTGNTSTGNLVATGTATIGVLSVTGNASVTGTLTLPGNTSVFVLGDGSVSQVTTSQIPANTVTNAKLISMNAPRIKGRITSGLGAPEDLTMAEVRSMLGLTSTDITGFGESVEDQVATLFTTGVHTGIDATYQDSSNRINLTLTAQTEKLTYFTAVDLSGQSTAEFTDIPACDRLEVHLVAVNRGSTATIRLQVSDDNGASYGTTKTMTSSSGALAFGQVFISNTGVTGTKATYSVTSDNGNNGHVSSDEETSETGVTDAIKVTCSAGVMYGAVLLKGYGS